MLADSTVVVRIVVLRPDRRCSPDRFDRRRAYR
jgi:hypothetical protein